MKQSFIKTKRKVNIYAMLCLIVLSSNFTGCSKHEPFPFPGGNNSADKYPSDVIDKWITMQLRLMRNSAGIANVAFSRYYAYSGIAAYEALTPGTTLGTCSNKWNDLTGLPQPELFKKYYWPASVNTALADMNRSIFINASTIDKTAIDSLETALNNSFTGADDADAITRANTFGKAVGDAVFNWSETDGYKDASDAYTPPVGLGLWVPTPPAYAPASTPYWGNNRVTVAGSIDNTQAAPPIPYSETPGSAFYQMVKELYDTSHALTTDDMNQALFWRDIPGVSSPGHWLSILQQVVKQTGSRLDKAAFAYAITGVCLSDACISCWQSKYKYNQIRPVTYIRKVFGDTSWLSFITTPAHPEYSAAHAVLSAATADAFTAIYGNIGSFTDHTYDYMGFPSRTYNSFWAIANEVGHSRFYGGIHYMPSVDSGFIQGKKVTANIFMKLGLSKKY